MFRRLVYSIVDTLHRILFMRFMLCGRIAEYFVGWVRPGFWWFLITYPFRLLLSAWHQSQWRHLLWGLPSVLALVLFVWFVIQDQNSRPVLADGYWFDARQAVAAKKHSEAETLLCRIIDEGGVHLVDARFALADLYSDTGHPAKAELLYQSLAPEQGFGHGPAHRRMAIRLCESLESSLSEDLLQRALHHLTGAQDMTSPEMLLAWGRYSIATGNLPDAKAYLAKSVETYPEVWTTLGTIELELGNEPQARSSYNRARSFFSEELRQHPDERGMREGYANVLIRLGELQEAEQVLQAGLKIDPDGRWKVLLSGLYVNVHDLLVLEGGHDAAELFLPLARALQSEPNFLPALTRLMGYLKLTPGSNSELHAILSSVVAEGKEPALAHLALGNLCFVDGDPERAVFHFERALSIDDSMTIVLNNLAWMVAHDQGNSDPDRALALVTAALEQEPTNGRFLDTRGSIFILMKRWPEALADLELIIDKTPDPAAVHAKLALVYDRLDFGEIAKQHRRLELEKRK